MLKKLRKSSTRVTLVLIGVAGLSGCGDGPRRDLYASREDCLADWGNQPEDCTPSTDTRHAGRGFFYGPAYVPHATATGPARTTGGASTTRSFSSSRSTSATRSSGSSGSTSRGGFGSSARSSSS